MASASSVSSAIGAPLRAVALGAAATLLCACRGAPPEIVEAKTTVAPAPVVVARESFVPREPRLMPAESLVRSYTAIFGDIMLPEHRLNYDASNRNAKYFGWEQHLSALGLPDYTRDHPRTTQTNTIMVAAFERLGTELCDRAAGRDFYPPKSAPVAPAVKAVVQVEAPRVFAFDVKPAPLSEADFSPRFDVLHRTFLGYPAALAPPERPREFYALYKSVESRHVAAKKGHAPHVSAWSAVCQGLVRHPEFHHY